MKKKLLVLLTAIVITLASVIPASAIYYDVYHTRSIDSVLRQMGCSAEEIKDIKKTDEFYVGVCFGRYGLIKGVSFHQNNPTKGGGIGKKYDSKFYKTIYFQKDYCFSAYLDGTGQFEINFNNWGKTRQKALVYITLFNEMGQAVETYPVLLNLEKVDWKQKTWGSKQVILNIDYELMPKNPADIRYWTWELDVERNVTLNKSVELGAYKDYDTTAISDPYVNVTLVNTEKTIRNSWITIKVFRANDLENPLQVSTFYVKKFSKNTARSFFGAMEECNGFLGPDETFYYEISW